MSKPRLLDLFCCQGGAAAGYAAAGFGRQLLTHLELEEAA